MEPFIDPSKVKIARRVVEILEYFAEGNSGICVADVVKRFERPQSSTSELLWALTEMGILYRDRENRRFYPTPRLASLGTAGQPEIIANGRLFQFMDRLAQGSRQSVALFGLLGPRIQVFRLSQGSARGAISLPWGAACSLKASAAGQLLLSTLGERRAKEVLWRLKSEAREEEDFDLAEACAQVALHGQCGHACGEAGFVPSAKVCAVLIPSESMNFPLAIGVVYHQDEAIDPEALLETLRFGIAQCVSPEASLHNITKRALVAI